MRSSRVKKAALRNTTKVVVDSGNIVRLPPEFCETGGDEAPDSPTRQNISHTGSWLDRRAFASTECYYTVSRGPRKIDDKQLTDGDRAFLKRCKDMVKKRRQTLQQSWQK